ISAGYVANKSTSIPFGTESRKQKTPPERGFFRVLRLVAAEHTVLRQRTKYMRSKTNAQFRHGF
ncbi:TPA: hypothetical protein ACK3QK_003659, partial [Enterobacter cloacae]